MSNHIQIGGLYEYIGKHKSTIWLDRTNWPTFGLELQQLELGDLFVMLKFETRPNDSNFLVCHGLFVKSGLMGGFVCYQSEIRLKEK